MKQPVFHGSLGVRSPQAYSHVPGRLESSTQQFVSRQRSRPCDEEVGGLDIGARGYMEKSPRVTKTTTAHKNISD